MIRSYIAAMRVYQWPKNLVVFGALVFAQQLHIPEQTLRSCLAFLIMCIVASSVYLLNDILDVERDRAHPEKRKRPLASGAISRTGAGLLSAVLFLGGMAVAYFLSVRFFCAMGAYVVLNVAYSLALKRVMVVDILAVSCGFVIRAIAGALVIDVVFSNWLVVCTLFLALFLSLGKRRREMELMEDGVSDHRPVLNHYTIPLVDGMMLVMAAATLLSYTIYTCSPEVVERVGTDKLYLTLPFVVYGLFRYLYLVYVGKRGGDPSKTLLKDLPLLVTVILWGMAGIAILYAAHNLGVPERAVG